MSEAAISFLSRAPSYKPTPHSLPCQLQSGLHALSRLHHFPSTPCQARPSLIFCSPHQVLQVLILLPSQAFIVFPHSVSGSLRSAPSIPSQVCFISPPRHARLDRSPSLFSSSGSADSTSSMPIRLYHSLSKLSQLHPFFVLSPSFLLKLGSA
ncbi:hypothetical protein AMECASPLE_032225 [Ameca splendens]|uniref:Uncharacterized protein n=1 Tax=Ameca splendens TaxID=208324 RepID=A0ABV0YHS0_9TELE